MQLLQDQPNLVIAFSAVIIILGLATVGYVALKWLKPAQSWPKIGSRLHFLWIMTGVFLLTLIYSRNILIIYLAFISFLALKEFLSITPTRRADRRVLFWAYLAIPIQFYLIGRGWYAAFIIFVPVYVFLFLPMAMVVVGETQGFLKANSTLNWGILTTVFSLGHLAYLLVLPSDKNPVAGGAGLFLFVMSLTQLNDVAQFWFGKVFNYDKIKLKVSVTRNWASLIGGMGSTAVISWLAAPLLTPLTVTESIAAGIIIAVGGFIGYITMSAIKDDLRLKDRGTMTPGHGGVLNRIDALIYTAPLFFHFVSFLHF